MRIPSSLILLTIKIIHTVVWLFFNGILFYLFTAVITNQIDYRVWVGLGCIGLEIVVLLMFRLQCPLTVLARRYSASTRDNFDIFLPNWLARYNKQIYSLVLLLILLLLVYRLR